MSDEPDNPPRRRFLTGLLVLPFAGCDSSGRSTEPQQATTRTLADLGKTEGARFLDNHGNEVKIEALAQSLQGKPSTLSFMFAACSDICPTTALALTKLSKEEPSLKHVVVSVNPFGDYFAGTLKLQLAAQGLTTGVGGNTIVLYPTKSQEKPPYCFTKKEDVALDIQKKFGLTVNSGRPSGHSGAVTLFGRNGNLIAQADDNNRIVETLAPELAAIKQR